MARFQRGVDAATDGFSITTCVLTAPHSSRNNRRSPKLSPNPAKMRNRARRGMKSHLKVKSHAQVRRTPTQALATRHAPVDLSFFDRAPAPARGRSADQPSAFSAGKPPKTPEESRRDGAAPCGEFQVNLKFSVPAQTPSGRAQPPVQHSINRVRVQLDFFHIH